MKSIAGVAVLAGAAVAIALPADTPVAQALDLPAASTALAESRGATVVNGEVTSRSSARAAADPAVVAPERAAPAAAPSYGVTGLKAVPKPKPTAEAQPQGQAAASDSGPAPANRSYSTGGSVPGLSPNAAKVHLAVKSAFGISNIGGLRPGDPGDHGTGHAVDVMITSQAQGDAVASFALANVGSFGIKYVIWRQRIWTTASPYWRPMADRGSITQNHYDHVHISVY